MNDIVITEPMVARGAAFCLAAGLEGVTREFMGKLLLHAMTPPKRDGKPSQFNPELVAVVFKRIANGESLRSICADPGMPDNSTFIQWVTVHGLSKQYAHARDAGAEAKFEELADLARTVDEETANATRVKADILKWVLSRLKPGKYGDKIAVDISGSINFSTMPDLELNARALRVLRSRLEPVFERLTTPTLEDVLEAFQVTPLPGQTVIEHDASVAIDG